MNSRIWHPFAEKKYRTFEGNCEFWKSVSNGLHEIDGKFHYFPSKWIFLQIFPHFYRTIKFNLVKKINFFTHAAAFSLFEPICVQTAYTLLAKQLIYMNLFRWLLYCFTLFGFSSTVLLFIGGERSWRFEYFTLTEF